MDQVGAEIGVVVGSPARCSALLVLTEEDHQFPGLEVVVGEVHWAVVVRRLRREVVQVQLQ